MKRLDHYWYSYHPIVWLLLPVSLLYCLLVVIRRFLFRIKILSSKKISKPVVVVGNITAGGTGKTPLIIELIRLLREWGYRPGVVSRGYGGNATAPLQINDATTTDEAGDEAVQIYQICQCPVVVFSDRVAAAELLIQQNEIDLVLSDDGLQHYRLQRDCEIIVIDEQRRMGNGLCLPAGPLREPRSRLRTTPWIVHNGGVNDYAFTMVIGDAINLVSGESKPLIEFADDQVHAVAGIGNPARFFNMLNKAGLQIIPHEFSDHYQYTEADLLFDDVKPVLMTQKDSVKCKEFARDFFWYVPVDIELSSDFNKDFRNKVQQLCSHE